MNISAILTGWYQKHRRSLPWRDTNDPYQVWVSEIILQQTRVDQGIDYYYRFLERFPDVGTLAKAPLDQVLKLWQGLGYYTRARNMHKAAQQIYYDHQGHFPRSYEGLIKLPGIGQYTASAVASFCFDQPVAVVDGNVARVVSRLWGIDLPVNSNRGKKELGRLAQSILSRKDPATHNQAIMEFGSLQCTPRQPDCPECPLKDQCVAYQNEMVHQLPVKQRNQKKRRRHFYYLDIEHQSEMFLHKRKGKDIWNSLYQFPLIETHQPIDIPELLQTEQWQQLFSGLIPQINGISEPYSHVLSHQKIEARFIQVKLHNTNRQLENHYLRVDPKQLQNVAVPRLIDKYLEEEKYPKKQ
jgi:A/G-specific adenine glycosylase